MKRASLPETVTLVIRELRLRVLCHAEMAECDDVVAIQLSYRGERGHLSLDASCERCAEAGHQYAEFIEAVRRPVVRWRDAIDMQLDSTGWDANGAPCSEVAL